jgi:hypothetical protein
MQKSQIAKKVIVVGFLVIFLFLILPNASPAQGQDRFGLGDAQATGLTTGDLRVSILNVIRVLLGFLGIIAVILIIYGGFIYMTAAGDPSKIEKAKKIITNAVVGAVIIMSSFIIVSFVINALQGNGGGGPGGAGSGGPGDFGRWGIGVGPIEDVYPSPNQNDVPINTIVVVTFKEVMNPATITMENIEICEVDIGTGDCVISPVPFAPGDFNSSTVTSTDDKTFTISPSTYLGSVDGNKRKFMVTLENEMRTAAEPDPSDPSVFNAISTGEFAWQFNTNGKLDLDPPEIMDKVGVYPHPDDAGDDYFSTAPATPTIFESISVSNVTNHVDSSYTQPVWQNPPPDPVATLSGTYSSPNSSTEIFGGTVQVDITNSGNIITTWPSLMGGFEPGAYTGATGDNAINIGPYGIDLALTDSAPFGSRWTFTVEPPQEGDRIELFDDSGVVETYVFGVDIDTGNYINQIATASSILTSCGSSCLQTAVSGVSTYDIRLVGDGVLSYVPTLGTDAQSGSNVNGLPDAYKNSIIQINFNEPVNPATIASSIIVRSDDGTGTFDAVPGYGVKISNGYRTVELIGPEECGVNSCNEPIFCWPVIGSKQNYEVEIMSGELINSTHEKCVAWGGVADNGRCMYENIDGNGANAFYPFTTSVDSIMDMSSNAFNGSFNFYQEGNKKIGIVEGRSSDISGQDAYYLNDGIILDPFSYGTSTPVYGVAPPPGGYGDNFYWSFYISSEIDDQAPLITTVLPIGDTDVGSSNFEVEFLFDRLMRSSSLRPGWNYGNNIKDKSLRYLVLQTINQNANPVGYWATKRDEDSDNNGFADKTTGILNHHNFDAFEKYGPLAGSGVQSINQNCYLPSAGPLNASKTGEVCNYLASGLLDTSSGHCADVTDDPNPASYGYVYCNEIEGASMCDTSDHSCKALYYDEDDLPATDVGGSWVITNENLDPVSGEDICCFGTCVLSIP